MPTLLQVAQSRVGIKETPGAKSNPVIDKWADDVGWPNLSDNDAWCSIFANSAALEAGLPMTAHNVRPLARGWLTWGKAVDIADIQPGDVAVWPRGKSTWQGHVNIVESVSDVGMVICIGGNQSNAVTRTKPLDPKDALGFRRAVGATVKDLRAAGSSEIKKGDNVQITGGGLTVVSGIMGAVASMFGPVQVPQFADVSDGLSWWQTVLGGINAIGKLVLDHPWIAGTILGGAFLVFVGHQIKAARLAKHSAGVPLSSQVEAANAAG
jgi:uncharacterized protein (TIGR02594 family)